MQYFNFGHISNLVNQKYLIMLMLNLWGFFNNQHGALVLEKLTNLFCFFFYKALFTFRFQQWFTYIKDHANKNSSLWKTQVFDMVLGELLTFNINN